MIINELCFAAQRSAAPCARLAGDGGRGLALVFADLGPQRAVEHIEAFLAAVREGREEMSGLLEARRDGRLVGAVFAQFQAGRTAVLWPRGRWPASRQPPPMPCWAVPAIGFNRGASAWSVRDGDRHRAGRCRAAAGRFQPAGRVAVPGVRRRALSADAAHGPLNYEPYRPANHDRLVRVIEASYEGTLDCPALDGLRTTADVLDGYQATGLFSPERWLIVGHDGRDVGCLILTDHPHDQNWELIYMGLVSAARGRGWGKRIAGMRSG